MANEISIPVLLVASALRLVALGFLFFTFFMWYHQRHKSGQRRPNGGRIVSMYMYFVFCLWLLYLVGCGVSHCSQDGRILYSLKWFGLIMLGISFVVVLIESGFSSELDYLNNFSAQDETAWEYIQKLRSIPPKIHMAVQCYHHEFRTLRNDRTRPQATLSDPHTVTVGTFAENIEFLYGSWVDISERDTLEACTAAIVRVGMEPCVLFGDQETYDDYKRLEEEIVRRNRHRDQFIDFSLRVEIPGMKRRFLGYVDSRVKPFWMRPRYYWIATLLWMTWPYRWLFRAKTDKIHYTLKKKICKSATSRNEGSLLDAAIANVVMVNDSRTLDTSNAPQNTHRAIPLSEISNPIRLLNPSLHPADGAAVTVPMSNNSVSYTTVPNPMLSPMNDHIQPTR